MKRRTKNILRRMTCLIEALVLIVAYIAVTGVFNVDKCYASEPTYTVGGSTFTLGYSGNGMEAWITGWSGTDRDIVIPTTDQWGTPIVSVKDGAFANCTTINTVYIPKSIYVNANVFSGCSNITAINVEAGNTSAKSVDGVLFRTSGNNVILEYYPPNKSGEIYKIPEGTTAVSTSAFSDTRSLKRLEYPSSVTEVNMVQSSSITTVDIPSSVTKINPNNSTSVSRINVSEGNAVYSSADGLLLSKDKKNLIMCPAGRSGSCTIPKTVQVINELAFGYCKEINEVIIPENVKKIEKWAFYWCTQLNNVNIALGVETIGDYAFSRCALLKSIYIPKSVNSIGSGAFGYDAVYYSHILSTYTDLQIYGASGSAAQEYAESNGFKFLSTNDITELKLYSRNPINHMEVGDCIYVLAQLSVDDVPVDEQGDYSFVISDSTIVDYSDMEVTDEGTIIKLNAKKNGSVILTVTNTKTGKRAYTSINVGDCVYNFSADNMPEHVDVNATYNAYVSGMYISDFMKTELDSNNYRITMNVYNSVEVLGAVDVFDKDNNIVRSYKIDKFSGGNLTSLYDTIVSSWNLIQDTYTLDILNFRNKAYTQETPLDIVVPKGGYIQITNNCTKSDRCLLYNCMDMVSFSILEAMDLEGTENVQKNLADELLESLDDKLGEKIIENGLNELQTEITISNATKAISDLTGDLYLVVSDLDLESIIRETALEAGLEVAEERFENLAGFAGTALSTVFTVGKYANFATQVINTYRYTEASVARIDTKNSSGELINNGICVDVSGNKELVLRTFEIKEGDDYNNFKNSVLESTMNFVMYDIYMLKDDVVTQPNGTVKVSIPLPSGYNASKTKVFRIEEDGTRTDMHAQLYDGYMVFTTDHFSLYVVAEDESYNTYGDANSGVWLWILAFMLVVLILIIVMILYFKRRAAHKTSSGI